MPSFDRYTAGRGRDRSVGDRRAELPHYFDSPTLGPANDRRAYAAELLVASTYGLPAPDQQSRSRVDLVLPSFAGGAAIWLGVKSTPWASGGLYIPLDQPMHALAYVLVTGEEGRQLIRGFAWRFQLAASAKVDKGYGLGHYVAQAKLRPLGLLMASHGLLAVE